ncbi:copper resistance protein NlpE N-terminal domain-containing protein [Empedobacter brevis]|uniref:Copper resistance protein NlpE N-terminal domain-containing protein n=1 Tax=Empedobacter brevis TaxID=247 RepID=A0AAJ1V955_9FLAO|nr:copper resistance protein NlpE [Empedobacter brevis]MDM1072665.1 copper resistance protein NlpE N-terminal domain-containing protein [Empedobacter brevis]
MKHLILSLAVVSFVLTSCETKKEEVISKTETASDTITKQDSADVNMNLIGDTSRTSLDWDGTYEGVLPCADCEGIKTILVLGEDGTYNLTQEYLNKNLKLEDKGKFEWAADGGSISIKTKDNGNFTYKVGENRLFFLDQEGKEITGSLAEHYILNKK